MNQTVDNCHLLSNIITIASLAVAVLSVASTIMFQVLAARRERDKIRYGIVYEDQFRVCKELYTRLSRLRDAVEQYTAQNLGPNGRHKLRPNLERRADAFRRSLRQNDVILDESLAQEVSTAWDVFKEHMYEYDDAKDRTGDKLPNQARKEVLAALDAARASLKPHIRRAYGISK